MTEVMTTVIAGKVLISPGKPTVEEAMLHISFPSKPIVSEQYPLAKVKKRCTVEIGIPFQGFCSRSDSFFSFISPVRIK